MARKNDAALQRVNRRIAELVGMAEDALSEGHDRDVVVSAMIAASGLVVAGLSVPKDDHEVRTWIDMFLSQLGDQLENAGMEVDHLELPL